MDGTPTLRMNVRMIEHNTRVWFTMIFLGIYVSLAGARQG